jgi:hypothetical protein
MLFKEGATNASTNIGFSRCETRMSHPDFAPAVRMLKSISRADELLSKWNKYPDGLIAFQNVRIPPTVLAFLFF